MTYDETTLFWRFMQDKGMKQNYEYFYANHRFDKRTLEEFLEQTDAEDAILSAFDICAAPNTIFNPKYWQSLNEKWFKRLEEYRADGRMIDLPTVTCMHCGRLLPRSAFAVTTKGQLHKHCRECETGEWDRKRKEEEAAAKEKEKQEKEIKVLEKEISEKQAMLERLSAEKQARLERFSVEQLAQAEMEAAAEEAKLGKTTKVCDHCGQRKLRSEFDESGTSPDGLQSWCRECQTAAARISTESDIVYERQQKAEAAEKPAATADSESSKYSPKLGEHDATLHYKPESRKIVFNAVLSAYIYTSGLTKCYLESRRDGRQFLVFNNAEGANVTWVTTKTSRLAQVCSTAHCRQIAEYFHLAIGELYYLHITKNLSKTKDVINIEIKQVHTREEYAAIAARREEEQKAGRPVPGEDIPEYETPEGGDAPLIDFSETEEPEPAPPVSPPKLGGARGGLKNSSGNGATKSPFGSAIRSTLAAKVTSQSLMIPLSGRKPEELLQQLIERNHLTEDDIAAFLYNKGWKLQKPVVVTTHKKFKV